MFMLPFMGNISQNMMRPGRPSRWRYGSCPSVTYGLLSGKQTVKPTIIGAIGVPLLAYHSLHVRSLWVASIDGKLHFWPPSYVIK